jgi:hypothetical protein
MAKKRNKKIPIFKDDLEFELFHSKVVNQLIKDELVFKKEYTKEIISKLNALNNEEERIDFLNALYSKLVLEFESLVGFCKENEMANIFLKLEVVDLLIENVKAFTNDNSKYCFNLPGAKQYIDFIDISFERLLKKELISADSTISSYKSIYNPNVVTKKVNWIGDISQLYLFVQLLVKFPEISKSKKWERTANCFTLDGEILKRERFHSQKKPKLGPKTDVINYLFEKI